MNEYESKHSFNYFLLQFYREQQHSIIHDNSHCMKKIVNNSSFILKKGQSSSKYSFGEGNRKENNILDNLNYALEADWNSRPYTHGKKAYAFLLIIFHLIKNK